MLRRVYREERPREGGESEKKRERERERETDTDTDFIVKATDPYTKGGGGGYNSVSVFAVA